MARLELQAASPERPRSDGEVAIHRQRTKKGLRFEFIRRSASPLTWFGADLKVVPCFAWWIAHAFSIWMYPQCNDIPVVSLDKHGTRVSTRVGGGV
jgi:hypothetical protein